MIHIYQIPKARSNGYCFNGGNPIAFLNVDWLSAPEDGISKNQFSDFIRGKRYFTNAPIGTRFLVLCDKDEFTFQLVKESA